MNKVGSERYSIRRGNLKIFYHLRPETSHRMKPAPCITIVNAGVPLTWSLWHNYCSGTVTLSRTVTAVSYHFTLIDGIMEIKLGGPGVGSSCGYEYHLGHVSRNCYTSDPITNAQIHLSESSRSRIHPYYTSLIDLGNLFVVQFTSTRIRPLQR